MDIWYFAYGSNLDMEQKEFRTGTIREVRRCRAPGYRFAFNKQAADGSVYANIIPAVGAETWGVIYRCSPETLKTMDKYEGVRGGNYLRHTLQVMTDNGEILSAVTYVAGRRFLTTEGNPRRDYLELVLSGARAHRLPEHYIQQIQALGTPK